MISQLTFARWAVGLLGLTMCVLMFGPFQGLEEEFGFTDKAAHGIAFYCLTLGLFVCFPRNRRTDLGLMVIGLAGLSEVIQALIGRTMSFEDFAADSTGIVAAMLPATVERFRRSSRQERRRIEAEAHA